MKARTSSPASWFPKASSFRKPKRATITRRAYAGSDPTTSSISSSGSLTTCPSKEKNDLYRKLGIGGIIRMDRDGKNREVYAIGLRNPVGMDFNPKDKSLWTNDNQVDGMGDDLPAGELNRVASAGLEFGFPWYGGGTIRTNEYKTDTPPANAIFPEVGAGRTCRGSRPDILHRHDVSPEIPAVRSSRHNTVRGIGPCRSARG